MKVLDKRWGEVTIKQQGEKKNKFDKTKSFSIAKTNNEYSIEELKDILEITVNLTEKYNYIGLKNILNSIKNKEKEL